MPDDMDNASGPGWELVKRIQRELEQQGEFNGKLMRQLVEKLDQLILAQQSVDARLATLRNEVVLTLHRLDGGRAPGGDGNQEG